ncbi:MAG TPA: VOC family protein, partial [Candidatus Binataceae bacterium]|nr:VOC family protein [Candidatus Binataceae bacterium]
QVLGLSVVARFGDQVLLQCGDQNLALFRVSGPPLSATERLARISHPLGRSHHAFRLSRESFLGARDQFAEAGMESAEPIDWGDHDCIYFLDPDGNLLELVSYR